MRDEIIKATPSGNALAPEVRREVETHLKRTRSAIKSGRTGAIKRLGGFELDLLNAVTRNPALGLYDAHQLLEEYRY